VTTTAIVLAGPERKRMKAVADELRAEDKRKWTNAKVGAAFGVDESTVRRWFPDTSNRQSPNTCSPTKERTSGRDARVKVSAEAKAIRQAGVGRQMLYACNISRNLHVTLHVHPRPSELLLGPGQEGTGLRAMLTRSEIDVPPACSPGRPLVPLGPGDLDTWPPWGASGRPAVLWRWGVLRGGGSAGGPVGLPSGVPLMPRTPLASIWPQLPLEEGLDKCKQRR